MKYLFIALLMLSFHVDAAVRRLATDCSLPSTAPTEQLPFDLDECVLQDGDEITHLLRDISAKWPAGFFIRAPSKSVTLVSDYVAWPTTIKYYVFLEDEDPQNKLLIQHKATNPATCIGQACGAFWTMWHFENFKTVKIGGPNLSITFKGNHPGLANCAQHYRPAVEIGWNPDAIKGCDINRGLLEFHMTDGTQAKLADVRANFSFTQMFAVYTKGNSTEGAIPNTILQFNFAGSLYATSGAKMHYGVKNLWSDPDRTVYSDPYMRAWGWTGEVPGKTEAGRPMGCQDWNNDQPRIGVIGGLALDSMKGGATIEDGCPTFVPRLVGRIGTSVSDPFIIRMRSWCLTGPGTGYPEGVRVKKTGESIFFKGDPADRFEDGGKPVRFLRFVKLDSEHGAGGAASGLPGCALDNYYSDGISNFARFESNVIGRSTRDYHIEFAGDWRTPEQGGTFNRGDLIRFGSDADTAANYRHTVRVASGTSILDTVILRDRSTVTGPGTWNDLEVTDASPAVQGKDSKIIDTNVAGTITVSANTDNTTVRNVKFTGAARVIVTIGDRANANVSNICAPVGSTIKGNGTLTYNSVATPLPFTITSALADQCSITDTNAPSPPSDVEVN